MPVAQTFVLRRVLMGGISTNSGCLVVRLCPVRTGCLRMPVWERCGGGLGGLVFGTLLGPEATGPGGAGTAVVVLVVFLGLVVSGFLAAPIMHVCVCGVCGLGLLFENYIVDASIFYEKQFPRI